MGPDRRRPWHGRATWLAVPVVFGVVSVALGRDANWDLQNYHWYNPYALLTWRYDRDVAPAMGQSFFSPLLYVPWFVLGTVAPARVLGFVIGAVHSVNLLLLYELARTMLPIERRRPRDAAALGLAAAGMGGGMSMGLLGTTFIDSVVTIGILGSALAVVAGLPLLIAAPAATAAWRVALAAIPAALALAGKLTVGPFVVGLAAGFLVVPAPLRRRLWLLLWFGIGGTVAGTVAAGPWHLHVWSMTGDPFYPFFARYFDSPFGGDAWSFDRWMPRDWSEAILYPFVIAAQGTRVAEVSFRDLRLALAYVLVPAGLALRLCWRPASRPPLAPGLGYLCGAMAVGYVLWLVMFSYYRYAVTLELLAPLVVTLILAALPFSGRTRLVMIGLLAVMLLVTTRPARWGHLPWSARFVEVSVPPIESPERSTVVLMGQPLSYVVPSLPPQVAVIALDMADWDGGNREAWTRLIRARLASRPGAVYAVLIAGREGALRKAAAPFGLSLDVARCQRLAANLPAAGVPLVNPLAFCALKRSLTP